MWHRWGICSLWPCTGSLGPSRRLKQMGQNPAAAETCLASQPWLGERGEALLGHCGPRCMSAMDGWARGCITGTCCSCGCWAQPWHTGRGGQGSACRPVQGPRQDLCQLFWGMERQVFVQLFPEDRNDWSGGLLSMAGGRSCAAPGMRGRAWLVVLWSQREAWDGERGSCRERAGCLRR